jgi:NAD(P)-dependent dehydrogenase (short-subunit alcohol dehydrogenase family)
MSPTVLITGTSTGIGRACAEEMAGRGWRVMAGVRSEEDGEQVRAVAPERIEPLILDVTDLDAIAAVGDRITSLDGLVNNAGLTLAGPLEHLPIEDVKLQLDVMLLAPFALTKALIPALRAARGRVVMMGSIGGRVQIPFMGPYQSAKAGLAGFAGSLRQELEPFGVHVALVEPGAITTPIWGKGLEAGEKLRDSLPAEAQRDYGERIDKLSVAAAEMDRRGSPPQKVADAVAHALTADKPKTRYLVGADARVQAGLRAVLPDRALDRVLGRVSGLR